MKIDEVKNVSVVGAGNMGHQIALQCALYGFKTVSTDVIPAVLEKAEKFCDTYLPGRVREGEVDGRCRKKSPQSYLIYRRSERGCQGCRPGYRGGPGKNRSEAESLCRSG